MNPVRSSLAARLTFGFWTAPVRPGGLVAFDPRHWHPDVFNRCACSLPGERYRRNLALISWPLSFRDSRIIRMDDVS
jgi:hypothetical protein